MKNILIIEDDRILNRGVSFALKKEYNIISAYSLEEGKKAIMQNDIDFLLLDINLTDGSGLDLCEKISDKMNFPIVFLTANDTEEDMIKGYERGCDDYISKPFSTEILKLKIKALLKNKNFTPGGEGVSGRNETRDVFEFKDLKIDYEARKVYKNGEEIYLTVTEYKLLELLSKNKNRAVTKELILDKIWDANGNYVDENAISVNIRRVRKKIENDPKNPEIIVTLFGIGYILGE